jgi:dCTP deaminase
MITLPVKEGDRVKIDCERHTVEFGKKFILHPGELALAPALEWFRLPPGMLCILVPRQNHARKGLLIGGGVIDPGYQDRLYLLIYNAGTLPLELMPFQRIASVLLYRLESKPAYNYSAESAQTSGVPGTRGRL